MNDWFNIDTVDVTIAPGNTREFRVSIYCNLRALLCDVDKEELKEHIKENHPEWFIKER